MSTTTVRRAPADVSRFHLRREAGPPVARVTALALAIVVTLECLRVLLPLEWTTSSDVGLVTAAATFPLLFLAPLLVPVMRRAGGGPALALAVGLLVVARLALQVASPAPFWLAAAATAAALCACVTVAFAVSVGPDGARVFVLAWLAGFALDNVLRGAYGTWDRAWRHGPLDLFVTLLVLAALGVAGATAVRNGARLPRRLPAGAGRSGAAVGLLLVPQVLFLQSPAFVASSGSISMEASVVTVVAGAAVAVTAASFALTAGRRSLGLAAGVALTLVVALLPLVAGAAVVALVVLGQALSAVVVTAALSSVSPEPARSLTRASVGATTGLLVAFVTLLLYQLHYEHPLPLSNIWLPALAVGAAAACAAARGPARIRVAAGWWTRGAGLVAGGSVVAAAGVAAALAMTAAQPPVAASAQWPLRVMTYNIAGGVTTSGSVDLAAVADRIRRSGVDVVALQEVYRGWPLAGTVDVAGWLQHELGWQVVWGRAADRQAGNLLLSRVHLDAARVVALPKGGGSMKRGAVIADLSVGGTVVTVVDAHLQHRNTATSMAARQAEMSVLLRQLGTRPNVVLMGDLNPRNPDLVDLSTLTRAGFSTAVNSVACTAPTSNANCSDYVLVRSGLREAEVTVIERSPFDHRPVIATLVPEP